MRTFAYGRRRFFIAPLIVIAVALLSVIVMLIWNAVITVIFNLPFISFWQAAGLLILTKILFGMGRPHSHWGYSAWRGTLRDKVSHMTPEERKEFFKKMHAMRYSWCHDDSKHAKSTENIQSEEK